MIDPATYDRYSVPLDQKMFELEGLLRGFLQHIETTSNPPDQHFLAEARILGAELAGRLGDGALEVYSNLQRDLSHTSSFVERWAEKTGPVLRAATRMRDGLRQMDDLVQSTPSQVMQEIKSNIWYHRNREASRGVTLAPTGQSFCKNLLVDCQPMLLALIAGPTLLHFVDLSGWRWWIVAIASAAMCLLSLHLYIQTRTVHKTKVTIDDEGMALNGPFGTTKVLWSSLQGATLFRRPSAFVGQRRMLRLDTSNAALITRYGSVAPYEYPVHCHISTFSREDEAKIVEAIERHVRVESVVSHCGLFG